MQRSTLRNLAVIGGIVTALSPVWEYARMEPDYRFLVDPWSFRGFESVHGAIAVTIGIALAAVAVLVTSKRATEPRTGLGIVGVAALLTAAIGFAFDPDDGFGFSAPLAIFFGLAIGLILMRVLQGRLIDRGTKPRSAVMFVSFVGLSVASSVVLVVLSGIVDLKFSFGTTVSLLAIVLATLSVTTRPVELAANRMLIYLSVVAGAATGLSAGAIRSTLLRFQTLETSTVGVASQYKDTQVTWGYFLANIGVMLVFLGGVSMWARRRDAILSAQRIAAQRAAAEASAAEIAAARAAAGLGAPAGATSHPVDQG